MPGRSSSALRYAEAIFDLARDHGTYDLWLQQLGEVEQLLADPLAAQVLASPIVPRGRKTNILTQALPDLTPEAGRFLEILARRNRLDLLPAVTRHLRELIDRERGIERATVITAAPLEPNERELLARRLSARTGKQVRIEEQIDPAVLGGVIARIGDEIIDGSVRGRLEQMRRVLAGT